MPNVLRNRNLFIIYGKNYLFFEWILEESDLEKRCTQRSSKFNLEDENSSYLEFGFEANGETYLRLTCTREIEYIKYITEICDCNNDIIFAQNKQISNAMCIDLIRNISMKHSIAFPILVSCTIKTSKIIQSDNSNSRSNESLKVLSSDLKYLLDQEINTDIVLKSDEDIIKAHRSVLVARSPVFRKMFHHDSREAADNTVIISDIKSTTIKKLVHYLYTAEMKKSDSVDEIMELYYAADKYEVLSLRQDCASELLTNISVENACSLFALASRHNDKEFLDELKQFIRENFKSVVKTDAVDDLNKDDIKVLMRDCA